MLAQSPPSTSRSLMSNYMNALSQSPGMERRVCEPHADADTDSLASSPESSSSVGFIEMSDLMLPASALESELFGVPQDSGATVVSAASCDELPPDDGPSAGKKRKSSTTSERRHSLPTTLMLSQSPLGEAITQPVPEFLCHLFAMLRDPSYADLISWSVPTSDEPDHMGGGICGIGKIIVHKPESLQDFVLGKYYRHSKYASFQRQLNYFGFKKRLHGGKKGKLSPCSYIHESLTEDAGSLFTLKRRPPAKKRVSAEIEDVHVDCAASESSHDDANDSTTRKFKKCKVTGEMKLKKSGDSSNKNKSKKYKKPKQKSQGKQLAATSMPREVVGEGCGSLQTQISSLVESNQFQAQPSITAAPTPAIITSTPDQQVSQPHTASIQPPTSSLPTAQPTLLELLSTSLPPSDILFDDAAGVESMDDAGIPAWVTDDGNYHYHNVDNSLIDLAMLY